MQAKIELAEGLEISRVITGLWQIADMERKGSTLDPVKTSRHMAPYVAAGLSTFDMADHYGSSEIIAGTFKNGLQDKNKVQLFTKWVPKPGAIGRDDVRKAVQTALDRMKQTTVDLLQFHAWYYPDPSWLDGLFYLKELQDEGLIKHLGVTNFDAAHLRMAVASGIPLVTNQVCHSLLDRRAEGKMTTVCKEYNVKLLAFGTLAGGFLTDTWLGRAEPAYGELSTWSQMKYKRFIDAAGGWEPYQNLLQTVRGIADKHKASIANIATRFVLENEVVAGVIVGARLGESDHIQDNKSMLDITLDPDDIESIKDAQKELNPIPGDCGDEYRKPPFLTASGDLSDHLETIPKAFAPIKTGKNREQIFSGTEWEKYAGYCRAVKVDNHIHVSGTTATHGSLMIGGNDPAAQTHFVIDKIEGVIASFGGTLADVVRTRIFVNRIDDWEPVARAHGERFDEINPANTLVEAKLVGDGYLVEIEAEAVIPPTSGGSL
jgi:aryl-alcohol dehydrogenase-like predicted oxidoreductase/enamine deaminase RidA (YjgF/YER057c/UK114 family)